MSIIATAKNKAFKGTATKGNMKEAFKNEEGAIDLASIMVGIIVIGLIGGVIAATVFAVIPWAQDNAAKQQLDSVASAQSAYIGLSVDAKPGGADQKFGGGTPAAPTKVVGGEVAGAGVVEKLFDGGDAKVQIAQTGTGSTAHYFAAAKSASGKTFYISDAKTQPTDNAKVASTGDMKLVVDKAALL